MLTQQQLQAIKRAFSPQAVSADTSRRFELTSIKAGYVVERLNEVFGTCGVGRRYVHSPFGEVVTEVALQYRHQDGGTHPVA